jgi:hypothetical protein
VAVEIVVTVQPCPPYTGGANCEHMIYNATSNNSFIADKNQTYYFKFNASEQQPVWASVRGVKWNNSYDDINNPFIFASRGQLPSRLDADVTICNLNFCTFVNSVFFNVSKQEWWYIGIQNQDPKFFNYTVAIWFNSICYPDCVSHGECEDQGEKYGVCDCIDGFIGADCSISNGFGPQFIVLIIIAVLVALTAIIGFGAWAYMRRKRGQYDIVS